MLTAEYVMKVAQLMYQTGGPLPAMRIVPQKPRRMHHVVIHVERDMINGKHNRPSNKDLRRMRRQITRVLKKDLVRRGCSPDRVSCHINGLCDAPGEWHTFEIDIAGWWARKRFWKVLAPTIKKWPGAKKITLY